MDEEKKLVRKLKVSRFLIIVLLLVLLITLIVVVTMCLRAKDFANNNNSNLGLSVSGGDSVFYYRYNSGIVRVKDDKEQIIVNEQAYSLNYDNGMIYYVTPSNMGGINLKKYDINKGETTLISSENTSSTKMFYENGYLYYSTTNPNTISKIDVNGQNKFEIIKRNIADFYLADDTIYFSDDLGYLYSIGIDGENYKVLLEKDKFNKFQYLDGYIYYYSPEENNLQRVSVEDTSKYEIVTNKVTSNIYNVTSEGIYYYDINNKKISWVNMKNTKTKDLVSNLSTDNTRISLEIQTLYYIDTDENGQPTTKKVAIN